MFSKKMCGDMRRAGMNVGLSKTKLSQNFQKLNDLADIDKCSVNKLVSKLIKKHVSTVG